MSDQIPEFTGKKATHAHWTEIDFLVDLVPDLIVY